ncbi:MAG TPA: histidine kinase [Bryobacteraceae bacterium]|nr:histidine kinase [Bryobacteraceae bacterium]
MIGAGAVAPYLAANLIGFTVGVVISLLLLVLTIRAARLPGTPVSNILLAVCALLWNAGGFVTVLQHPQGTPDDPGVVSVALAIQFTGAGLWPVPLLAIWRHLALERWQCVCWRYLTALAYVDAAVIVIGFWAALLGPPVVPLGLKEFSAYNATFLGLASAALLLRGRSVSRSLRFSYLVVLAGLVLTTLSVIVQTNVQLTDWLRCTLGVIGHQSVLLVVIGTFFLFARFRFADLFIRYTVGIVLASIAAAILILVVNAPFVQRLSSYTEYPSAVRFFVMTLLAAALLVCFSRLDRKAVRLVNRWIFNASDYRNAVREISEQVQRLYSESEVTAAVEGSVRKTLGLEDVRSIGLARLPEALWPAEIHDGQVSELPCGHPLASLLNLKNLEWLVPVRAEGRVISVLAISPGLARRGIVSQEVDYLRGVAEQFGSRLDLLRLEREMVERQSRETLLLQQVTEAELRALRAQINPHFLFNSLNTIANLIVTDPPRAETMTLRLAKVFRHVLAHSSRPLAPIHEEIEFLRSYLEIEEARFGSRLQVEIDVSPEVRLDPVPSLILQPVVENALKHGLGPKTGAGRLWISAKAQGDQICLAVEDDGVGPQGPGNGRANGSESNGVGLRNITQRLATLYQERARVTLEPRMPEGTRVTLLMPRQSGRNGHEKPHS